MKRDIRRIQSLLAVFLLGGLVFAGPGSGAEKLTFMLDWHPLGQHSAFYAAMDEGFYRKEGLDVSMIRGFGSGDTIKNIAAGKEPIGFADYGSLVIARSRGVKVKGMAVLHDKNPHAVYTLKGSGIREPKDLSGRSFADAAGAAVAALMPAFAKATGISGYQFVPVDAAAKNAVLLSGKVDSMGTFVFARPTLLGMAKKSGKEIVEFMFSDYGIDVYSNGLVARDDYLEAQAARAKKFVHGAIRAWAWAVEHPDKAVSVFQKHNPAADPAMTRAAWEIAVDLLLTQEAKKLGIGHMTRDKMQRTIAIMTQYANLQGKVRPEEMYTNAFLPKLFPKRPKP